MFENEHTCAREYTICTPAHLWRNWREQLPSNQGSLGSNVTGRFEGFITWRLDLLLVSFCTVVRDCYWGTF
jgi:hypothetical protein